ncbi:MAG: ASCH domain-containing protein [Planctomycetia bacterium]|nr:ASCH domain-containing protein [Planctomycetia bacterium]
MKCLSLMQPWATLVLLGAKRYETRDWQTEYRGALASHASRTFPEAARVLCAHEPFRSVLRAGGFNQPADLGRGVLLGTVELIDCRPAQEVLARLPAGAAEAAFGDFRAGRWAWELARPGLFDHPTRYVGRLGLFDVPEPS